VSYIPEYETLYLSHVANNREVRRLSPFLGSMRDLASLYFLIRHTFVCGTLLRQIKLNLLYLPNQSRTYKNIILPRNREAKSQN
jgi:hypothetical protein